jgi:hypothetical protein
MAKNFICFKLRIYKKNEQTIQTKKNLNQSISS